MLKKIIISVDTWTS